MTSAVGIQVQKPRHPEHASVVFVGGPGTGKSTLAQALNVRFKMAGYDSEFAPEFGRAYLRRSGPMLVPFEQFIVFAGAAQREDELSIHQFIISDSASFLSTVYYQYIWMTNPDVGTTAAERIKLETGLNELRRMCRSRLLKTPHIFFVPPSDFGPAATANPDPTRTYLDHRERLSSKIKAYLDDNDADYHTVSAIDLEERLDEVWAVLDRRGAFTSATPGLPVRPDSTTD